MSKALARFFVCVVLVLFPSLLLMVYPAAILKETSHFVSQPKSLPEHRALHISWENWPYGSHNLWALLCIALEGASNRFIHRLTGLLAIFLSPRAHYNVILRCRDRAYRYSMISPECFGALFGFYQNRFWHPCQPNSPSFHSWGVKIKILFWREVTVAGRSLVHDLCCLFDIFYWVRLGACLLSLWINKALTVRKRCIRQVFNYRFVGYFAP